MAGLLEGSAVLGGRTTACSAMLDRVWLVR
jgi:hypothetical protein